MRLRYGVVCVWVWQNFVQYILLLAVEIMGICFIWFFYFLSKVVASPDCILLTCVSEVTSSCRILVRPDDSSFNKSASAQPVRFVKPAKMVNPISSSLRAKHQARGLSQPVIKIALPLADTYIRQEQQKQKEQMKWNENEKTFDICVRIDRNWNAIWEIYRNSSISFLSMIKYFQFH